MHRPETGRRAEDDNINARIDELLIGVKAKELAVFVDLQAAGDFLFAESGQGIVDTRLVDIGDGVELGVIVGMEGLGSGSSAPASGTNEADLDCVGDGLAGNDGRKASDNACCHGAGSFQKLSTIWV